MNVQGDVRQAVHERAEKAALKTENKASQIAPERMEGKILRAMETVREKTGAE